MQTFTLSFHVPGCCFAAGVVLCEKFEAYLDLLLKTSWPMFSYYLFDRNANVFMANILFINNLILYGAAIYMSYC